MGEGRGEKARGRVAHGRRDALRAPTPSLSSAVDWWKHYFDAGYEREYEPLFDLAEDRRQVARLVELLELPAGSRVLDLACGQGRHAHLLAEAGFNVDGLDLSPYLIARAKERGTGRTLHYRRGDMRKLPAAWSGRFDAVVNLFTSFGFFADARDDARVLRECARVLKPGGVMVWQGGSRDGVMARFLASDWWTTRDGTMIAQDRSFDPLTGFLTITSVWQRRSAVERREHRIRLYTASRMAELMLDAGLVVEQAWESFTDRPLSRRSSEMLLVARRES